MLGERIKERRDQIGMTQHQLCIRTGLHQGYLSRIENNQIEPGFKTVKLIAKELDVSLDYLSSETAPAA